MASCKICGKKNMAGRNIRHKHTGLWERKAPRTLRVFKVNIHKKNLLYKGQKKIVQICSKCLKRIKKDGLFRNFQIPEFKKKTAK